MVQHKRQGVILVALGTPEEPTPRGVKRFLSAFLGDQRVVEIPRLFWWPLLHGIILPIRSRRVAKAYAEIWREDSPLRLLTEEQTQGVAQTLAARGHAIPVRWAVSYGAPSIAEQIDALEADGVEEILLLPLYPQFSATTTAPIYDQLARLWQRQRNLSDVRVVKHYHHEPAYIAALAHSVRDYWQQHGQGKLLISFHGIPKRNADLGDPYRLHCEQTAQALAQALELTDDQWQLCYQSRFGFQEWLQPYTSELLEQLGGQGCERVDVICPAFAADCLETVEEIDGQNRELFLEAGGKSYHYIPCLNARADHLALLADLVLKHLPRHSD